MTRTAEQEARLFAARLTGEILPCAKCGKAILTPDKKAIGCPSPCPEPVAYIDGGTVAALIDRWNLRQIMLERTGP